MDTALLTLGMFSGKIVPGSEAYGDDSKDGLATYSKTELALKIVYVETSIYYSLMYCIKWSMISFYFELFPKSQKKLRTALKITTYFTVLSWAVSLLVKLFICQPMHSNWNPDNYCNTNTSYVSNGTQWALHCATDVVIYILPLFLLRKLQLRTRQKIGVGITFSMGFICIFFAFLFHISILKNEPTSTIWLYSALEQSWALIVVCCPAFKQLLTGRGFRRALVGRFDSGTHDTGRGPHHTAGSRISKSPHSQALSANRFSRQASNAGMSVYAQHDMDDQERELKKDTEFDYGITVSYEMEAHSNTGDVDRMTPNVSAAAWSTV